MPRSASLFHPPLLNPAHGNRSPAQRGHSGADEFLTEGLLPHPSHLLCHNATQTVYPENPDAFTLFIR